jgi:hypothetical protein
MDTNYNVRGHMIKGRNGKELSRSGMLAWCANRALAKLKTKYYDEYREFYEAELASAGISFKFENQKLLWRENQKLRKKLKELGVDA